MSDDERRADERRADERRTDERRTDSGIRLDPIYTAEDLDERGFDPDRDLGEPGEPPFTRGVYSSMYRGRLWTMRQYAGMATADETNRRFHYLLDHGQTGLSVAFDLPTQMGYDSDHPPADGVDADHHRPLRLLRRAHPALEHDLDQRLPHARGGLDRGARGRVHPGERHRLRAGRARCGTAGRRLRAALVLLLRVSHELLRGGGEVSRGATDVGEDHDRPFRREGSAERDAALPHADRRGHPHRATAADQHRAHGARGDGRGPRRHAVPAHERVRR